jgi:hypothetical protein
MLGFSIFQVEFFVNLCCPKKWGSTFVMAGPKCNVVFDDGGIPEIFEDTPFIPSKEANLLQALKAIMQEPPLHLFKDMILCGCLILQVVMDYIPMLKLQSSHGIV